MDINELSNTSNSRTDFYIPNDDNFILKYTDLKFLENSKANRNIDITELTIYQRYPSDEYKYLENLFYNKIMITQKLCTSESLSVNGVAPKKIKIINYCTSCDEEIGHIHSHIETSDKDILYDHQSMFIEYLQLQGAEKIREQCIEHIRYSLLREGFSFTCTTYFNMLIIELKKPKVYLTIIIVLLILIVIIIISIR